MEEIVVIKSNTNKSCCNSFSNWKRHTAECDEDRRYDINNNDMFQVFQSRFKLYLMRDYIRPWTKSKLNKQTSQSSTQ